MLEHVDLSLKLDHEAYDDVMPALEIQLAALQRSAIEAHVPVIIAYEGWEAAGKGKLINRMIHALDPRHFSVYSVTEPNDEERDRAPLWRFWTRLPAQGRMSILDRSWYDRVLFGRANKTVSEDDCLEALDEVRAFERQLVAGGYVIIKLFLHISKKTQKKRYERIERDPSTSWKITKRHWVHHRRYDAYWRAANELLEKGSTPEAPWHVIAAENRRYATVKVFESVCQILEEALAAKAKVSGRTSAAIRGEGPGPAEVRVLQDIDLSASISREDYAARLDGDQDRLRDLQHEIYLRRIPVVVAYEGWDAAGKGGNIKRLTQSMDPRGYDVIPIGAPNDIEKQYHYLWRFWKTMPKAGHVIVFDRTWYGRVLVERVERFASNAEWQRAYGEINEMEEQWIRFGAVLVKFWLHIDKDEQLRRFEERQATPHKRWKITDEDWKNRENWDRYYVAANDMLARTSTSLAPWTIVESNSKHFARLKALRTVIHAIEQKL